MKTTIIDCLNLDSVIYLSNKSIGAVSFINCEHVTGIEFDVATKVTDIDCSNLPKLKYLNIQRTNIKTVKDISYNCMVYCRDNVIINRNITYN